MAPDSSSVARQQLRADAARNRETLLAVATRAFAASGTEPSMREIAREAGVGVATLFRHFPTREALVDAVYQDQVVRLTTGATDLLANHAPARALRLWMDLFADWMATKHGMTSTLLAMIDAGDISLAHTRQELLAAITVILDAGTVAGDIRADTSAEDIAAALIGILAVAAKRGQRPQAQRLFDLLMDGLRPQPAPLRCSPRRPRCGTRLDGHLRNGRTGAGALAFHQRTLTPFMGFRLFCGVVQPDCAFVQRLPYKKPLTIRSMVITSPQGTNPSAIDMLEFRRALGHFATGVTVVTYQPEGIDEFRGTTVNSFTSVSLDPPLILVSLGRQTRSAAALQVGSQFAVNVLHHGQRDLAMHFAGRPQPNTNVEWEVRAGVPHLAGCGAHFRCVAQDVHGAGDHVLVIGLVEEFQAAGHLPLLFYRGSFEHLHTPVVPQPAAEIFTDFPELW